MLNICFCVSTDSYNKGLCVFFFNPSWCGEGLLLFSSCSVMSNSLWPRGLQHASLPSPSLSPRVCSNSCPLNPWCHPTISPSVVPFFCLQCLPASRSFPVSWLLASGGQSIRASASASVLPMNIHSSLYQKRKKRGTNHYVLTNKIVLLTPPLWVGACLFFYSCYWVSLSRLADD